MASLLPRVLVPAVALCAFTGLHAFAAEPVTSDRLPQILPAVKVAAEVPLVKVAEYKMREPRYAPAVVAQGDFIYIIGGLAAVNEASKTIERLDVRTGQTEIIARLEVARFWHRAVLAGDKIYILGGASPSDLAPFPAQTVSNGIRQRRHENGGSPPPDDAGSGGKLEPLSSVEILDLGTGRISPGPKLPEARWQFACVRVGQQIWALGGKHEVRGRMTISATTAILDLAKNEWQRGVPLPQPLATDASLVDGDFIVIAGGYDGQSATRRVHSLHPRTLAWKTIPALCRDSSAHASVFFGHHLFLFGDYAQPGQLLAYNLRSKESEVFTLGYTAARHTAAVSCAGKIYIIGGRADLNSEPLNVIQVFAPTHSASRSR